MSVDTPQRSRLRFTDLLTIGGVEFWDMVDFPTVPEQTDDLQYQVMDIDRIDTLANQFYGSPIYWWVIAVANDMEIVEVELNVGAILRIPSPRYVRETLFTNTKV